MFLLNERVQAIFFSFQIFFFFVQLSSESFLLSLLFSFFAAFGSKHSLLSSSSSLYFLEQTTKKSRKRKSFSLLKDLPRVPSIPNSVSPSKFDFFLNTLSTSVFLSFCFCLSILLLLSFCLYSFGARKLLRKTSLSFLLSTLFRFYQGKIREA
jgi:hypothetical protein